MTRKPIREERRLIARVELELDLRLGSVAIDRLAGAEDRFGAIPADTYERAIGEAVGDRIYTENGANLSLDTITGNVSIPSGISITSAEVELLRIEEIREVRDTRTLWRKQEANDG